MAFKTPEEYYSDESNYGESQYITLDKVINTFMLRYVGDDKLINNVRRYDIVGHAKRGLEELSYDTLREIRKVELEIDDKNEIILPNDYVNYVRISWVDNNGYFRPIIKSTDTGVVESYLQDNEYRIVFDSDGFPVEATSTTSKNQENLDAQELNAIAYAKLETGEYVGDLERQSAKYGLDPSRSNINGEFYLGDGFIKFSQDIPARVIVLEYVSDVLNRDSLSDIRIDKMAENALYSYIRWQILSNKIYTPEYIVRRSQKDWFRDRQNSKLRIANLKPHQFIQKLKARRKWLK